MSGQEAPEAPRDPEQVDERPRIQFGPGKTAGDFRFRMTASRSGKVSDGNYGSQDAFFSMSVGFDDPADAGLGDIPAGELLTWLKSKVNDEYLASEAEIRERWGLGKTPDRRPKVKQNTMTDAFDKAQTEEAAEREAEQGDPTPKPARRDQVAALMKARDRGKGARTQVDQFVKKLGKKLVKELTEAEAGDLLVILDSDGFQTPRA